MKVSTGCAHCYAEQVAKRYGAGPGRRDVKLWGPGSERRIFGDAHWQEPERWNRKAEKEGRSWRVFSGSMCDVFEDHPAVESERLRLWNLIRRTPRLDWLILTKRPENMARMLPDDWLAGWGNVWLGVSVENAEHQDRIDILRETQAVIRFVSYEPALGPLTDRAFHGIDWLIAGGESGKGFRPDDVEWFRYARRMCDAAGVAFWMKQRASLRPDSGNLDGERPRAFPMRQWHRLPRMALEDHLEMARKGLGVTEAPGR